MSQADKDRVTAPRDANSKTVLPSGKLRVQFLSRSLVRIEQARLDGTFCDSPTFTVKNREFPGVPCRVQRQGDAVEIQAANLRIELVDSGPVAEAWSSITIRDAKDGLVLWTGAKDYPVRFRLPAPENAQAAWALLDSPRAVPPPWGAAAPPQEALESMTPTEAETSGWRLEPDARDVYVFLYRRDTERLRHDFRALTGPVPLPPLWTLGLWHSRYFPYNEETALAVIDAYREHRIPLDVFVLDTDWRIGASRGYRVNTRDFPDMQAFLAKVHERHVKAAFNDHPEPRGMKTLDPELLRYREDNLTRLTEMGLDLWWFDRNWADIIPGPVKGIETAVWGQCLYYDILRRHYPGERTTILSMRTDHPAAHRYPLWWTGDIHSDWHALREGIRTTVEDGTRMLPWTGQDIGGHIGFPSPEQYVRWVQWGCLSPTMRLHSGPRNRFRYPWAFGPEALDVARRYVRLRYRLLPVFYAAARHAYDTGIPLLRKLSCEWPQFPEAATWNQMMLGDDILLAPTLFSVNEPEHLNEPLVLPDGFRREVFDNPDFQGDPVDTAVDESICIDPQNISEYHFAYGHELAIRWTGTYVAPRSAYYKFVVSGNGRKQLHIKDEEFPEVWDRFDIGTTEATRFLEEGEEAQIRLLFRGGRRGSSVCRLEARELRDASALEPTPRTVWLPPGSWQNIWTGECVEGPRTVTVAAELHQMPMFVRRGGIVPLAPPMEHTADTAWNPLTVDFFAPVAEEQTSRMLYEDDGHSTGYQTGECRQTPLRLRRQGNVIEASAGPGTGTYPACLEKRTWVLRIWLLPDESPASIEMNGQRLAESEYAEEHEKAHWRLIVPMSEADGPQAPFEGRDAPAPSQSGSIVQVVVADSSSAAATIRVK